MPPVARDPAWGTHANEACEEAAAEAAVRRNAERPCRAMSRSNLWDGLTAQRTSPRTSPDTLHCWRLPREGVGGRWLGEPGRSGWVSQLKEVKSVTRGRPVMFRRNFPDFRPYAKAVYRNETLNGTNYDFKLADIYLAGSRPRLGLADACAAAAYRQRANLTWHHHEDAVTLLLVPRALHENVPHAGGASLLRQRRWSQPPCVQRPALSELPEQNRRYAMPEAPALRSDASDSAAPQSSFKRFFLDYFSFLHRERM